MLPFELTKDTPYLALSGELWSVFYEYFNRNWSCYKGFLLYLTTGPECTVYVRNYNLVLILSRRDGHLEWGSGIGTRSRPKQQS